MKKKNVFVQAIYLVCGDIPIPCKHLHSRDLLWIKSRSLYLSDNVLLVEYVDGIRTALCRVVNGHYVDITL